MNRDLMLMSGLTMISFLAISISTLSISTEAESQNQTSSQQSQIQPGMLTQKFRDLVTKSGTNITMPQNGNLADQLRNFTQSSGFKKLSQSLPQLSELGINETTIKDLQQKGSTDLPGLVQKIKNLTNTPGT